MIYRTVSNAALSSHTEYYIALKVFIFLLDRGRCHICGKAVTYKKSVLDHIIPHCHYLAVNSISLNEYWNLRLAHRKCNSIRSNGKIAGQPRLPIPEIIKTEKYSYAMS